MFSFRSETKDLNDETRRWTGGSFVALSDGVTHYELSNSTSENTVVLVHGFSVPYFIFDPTFRFLSQHGFRVLRYDLFGRGFSDRPDTEYNIDLFERQLSELLDALQFTRPVSLVGLSMGGPITATFTARHPERVNKIVWIDPAGARSLSFARLLRFAAKPKIGEFLLNMVGTGKFTRSFAAKFVTKDLDRNFQKQYFVQLQFRGTRNAILSTVRNHMLEPFLDTYRQVGKLNKRVLLIWGREDTLVLLSQSVDIFGSIPNVEFHIIEEASHIPHYEKPEETNPLLLQFLSK
ncbi:MAG TPA: alpha/beta hydrolase [Anaerolineales bacterium]|nr:alpha/beta hydrolase [Anaerolineales bacterium]